MITGCANDILRRSFTPSESEPDTKSPEVGPLWTQRFLERHPEYKVRKQRRIDSNRKNAHAPEAFEDWFRRCEALVDEEGIQPGDMCNFKISGDGTVLPPMVILSGVLYKRQWYTATGIPDDTLIALPKTGYSNDDLSLEWLAHFERFTSRWKTGAYRILLLDGYATVLTAQSSLLTAVINIISSLFVSHHILPISYNLSTLLYSNCLITTMLRQLSKRHGPAAPISTKSNSCMHFILSKNRLSKKHHSQCIPGNWIATFRS